VYGPSIVGIEGSYSDGLTRRLDSLRKAAGHFYHRIGSPVSILIDVENNSHGFFHLLVDHPIDEKLKCLKGATMFPYEDPVLIPLDFKIYVSFLRPKFLRYQESNLLIPKLFLRKRAFIYMTTAQGVGKPVPEAEICPLIDKT